MEKETIIAFLNDHWDEFVSVLADTNRHDGKEIRMEQFPDHIREFTAALSTLVASYQTQCENTQTEQEVHPDAMSADWVPDAAFECCDADNRGLFRMMRIRLVPLSYRTVFLSFSRNKIGKN